MAVFFRLGGLSLLLCHLTLSAQDTLPLPLSFGESVELHCTFTDARNLFPEEVSSRKFPLLPPEVLSDYTAAEFDQDASLATKADSSLQGLLDHLDEAARTNPRKDNYNGPEFILSSGYRLRLNRRGYWQLFTPGLRPAGKKISRLPLNQPFKDFFLAATGGRVELRSATGERIPTGDKQLLSVTEAKFIIFRDKNGLLGVMDHAGTPILPAIFTSIYREKYQDIQLPNFSGITEDKHKFIYFPTLDLALKDAGTPLRLTDKRYLVTTTNVFDLQEHLQLFCPPSSGKISRVRRLSITEPLDTLLTYTGHNEENSLTLFTPNGKVRGKVASASLTFVAAEADGYYFGRTISSTNGKDPKPYKIFDRHFNVIYQSPQLVEVIATDPPLLFDAGAYSASHQHFISLEGDTLLTTARNTPWQRIGPDSILVEPEWFNDRLEEAYLLLFSVGQQRITDTLHHTQFTEGKYFMSLTGIRDRNFKSVVTPEDFAKYHAANRESPVGLPITYRSGCCGRVYATAGGEVFEDEHGNRHFQMIESIDDSTFYIYPAVQSPYRLLARDRVVVDSLPKSWFYGKSVPALGWHVFHLNQLPSPSKVLDQHLATVADSILYTLVGYDRTRGMVTLSGGPDNGRLIDWRGKPLMPSFVTNTSPLGNGHYFITVNGKKGIADRRGSIVYPPVFSRIRPNSLGYYEVDHPATSTTHYLPFDPPAK